MPKISMPDLLLEAPARLAPMASLTNVPFRQIAVRCGSGFTTNEEIDADALVRGNVNAWEMARSDASIGPVAMQLLGGNVKTLVPAARQLVEAGADIIDLNMGCPVTKIVRQGKGAALMRDVSATARILTALRRELDDVPFTIKIRGGWNDGAPNAVEVARMAADVGVDAITVHPRSRAQQFGGQAPWDVIRSVVEAVSIPVTGNGDVLSLGDGERMRAETGCVDVMIGRGALGRPWVFDPAYERLDEDSQGEYRTRIVGAHIDAIEAFFPPKEALLQTKKHLIRYTAGGPEAKARSASIFASKSIDALREAYAVRSEVVAS